MYDIIIIGAGPAGSTLARLLDRKYKVLLIDKRNLSDDTDFKRCKCCGGLLAPAAQKALARQGLGIPETILTGPQTFSVKSIDFDNNITKFYQRHYINIDREKFDRWLISLIPVSVDKAFGYVFRSYKEEKENYKIEIEKDGKISEYTSRILVGADGAVSRIREQAFKNKEQPDRYISIQEHYKTKDVLPYYVSVFDKEVSDFYSWIIQKENELLIGTAVPENSNAEEKYSILTGKLKKMGYISSKAIKRTGTILLRPAKIKHLNFSIGRIALAGEAAGLISPSSAEGISYAIESAKILSSEINAYDKDFGIHYYRSTSCLRKNLFYKKLKVALMYNKFTRKIIMKSGILSMKIYEGEL